MLRDSSAWIALSGAWVHARPAVALQGRQARWLVRPGTPHAQTMLCAASWLRYALAICRAGAGHLPTWLVSSCATPECVVREAL